MRLYIQLKWHQRTKVERGKAKKKWTKGREPGVIVWSSFPTRHPSTICLLKLPSPPFQKSKVLDSLSLKFSYFISLSGNVREHTMTTFFCVGLSGHLYSCLTPVTARECGKRDVRRFLFIFKAAIILISAFTNSHSPCFSCGTRKMLEIKENKAKADK